MLKLEHAAKGDLAYFTCACGTEIEVTAGYDSDQYLCECGEYVCEECRTYCIKCESAGCKKCLPLDDYNTCQKGCE
jgi:hypothetical protein